LPFTFSGSRWKEQPADLTIDEPEVEFELGAESAETMALPAKDPPAISAREQETESAPATVASGAADAAMQDADEDEDLPPEQFDDEPFEEQPVMPRAGSIRPIFMFLMLVVVGYGALASTLRQDPVLTESLLRKLPFMGRLTEDHLLNRKIVIKELNGGYQRIKDNQRVFVITGQALNNSAVSVGNVQILGRLFDSNSAQLDEKTIFCGNVISMKILRSLTQREVSILQNLRPPKRFAIAPGEESTFVIVFMRPPSGVAEFSSQVIGAQRQA
jgi:hypothetical protein